MSNTHDVQPVELPDLRRRQVIAAYKAAEALVKTLLGLCRFKDATQTFGSGSI